jgi:hypothetical protein
LARPTNGTLTGGGFTQVTSTTKYTKAAGSTGTSVCDIGNGNASTGVAGCIASTTAPIASADLTPALNALSTAGAQIGAAASVGANGLQYYGITV